MEDITDEHIEQYLQGQLGDEKKAEIENQLKEDADFKKYVDQHHAMIIGIKEISKSELKKEFSLWENVETTNGQNAKTKKLFVILSGIAASLLLIIVAVYLFNQNTSTDYNQIAENYYKPFPNYITSIKRDETSIKDLKKEGMYYYEKGNYEKSIINLEKYLASNQWDIDAQFYIGCAYISQNQTLKAITSLSLVADDKNNQFREIAYWYLGIAFLKNNQPQKAKQQFNRINKDHEYYNQAQEILMRIE